MKHINYLSILIVISMLGGAGYLSYNKFFAKKPKTLFKCKSLIKKDIYQIINTQGSIHIKDRLKIGSLVSGTVEKILVKEKDKIKKGATLAIIETGKADTEVEEAKGFMIKKKAEFDFQKEHYFRQRELFNADQLSKETFERETKLFLQAKADLFIAKATLSKKTMDFKNTHIKSPDSGTVTTIKITEGERVSVDLKGITLFEIAKDLTKMEAYLDIDESDIGYISKDQKVYFTVDSFPNRNFRSQIKDLSYSPKFRNGTKCYEAIIDIDNQELIFRPGMTINAKVTVSKAKQALAIDSQGFMINPEKLKKIARILNYDHKPLDKSDKKTFERKNKQKQIKYVWVVEDGQFVEKPIIINVTDDIHFEVVSGLSEHHKVIVDIEEPDKMGEIYKKMFSKF